MYDMTSYFQDGGHDVRPPIAVVASAGCPLAGRARMTSLARCIRYSYWSIVQSYLYNAKIAHSGSTRTQFNRI